jgi:hypothetical protein
MGPAKGLMENCSPLFASVRSCSAVFVMFELFAIVLSLYNEHLNSCSKVLSDIQFGEKPTARLIPGEVHPL